MTDIGLFVVSLSVTVVVSALVALTIRRSFRKVLIDLTGAEARADFWMVFTTLLLILVPVIVLMFVSATVNDDLPLFFRVIHYLKWSLVALVATLVAYAFVVIRFVLSRPAG